MANRTYLLGINEDFFHDEKISLHELLEASYCLPLFWLTLYQLEDIRLYNGTPLLLTTRAQALSNIDQRAAGMISFLGEPSRRLVTQWREFVEQNNYANYLVNTRELAQMENSAGEFLRDLKSYFVDLAAMVRGEYKSRELSLVVQASRSLVEYPYIDEPVHLCGHSFAQPMPWVTTQF